MTLVSTAALLSAAYTQGGGLAAVDVSTLEQAEGVVLGAEQAGLPVVLQVSRDAATFHLGDAAPFAAALAVLAGTSLVEVSLHRDGVGDAAALLRAAEDGFRSATVEPAPGPYEEHVRVTAEAVQRGHERGLLVQGVLGAPDAAGELESPRLSGVRTDPGQAAAFVAATGVDALVVGVGLDPAGGAADPPLDLDLVRALAGATGVPLALPGSSEVPQRTVREAVRAGLTLVTYGAATTVAMTRVVRQHLHDLPDVHEPRQYLTPARKAVSALAAELVATVGLAPPAPR